MTLLKKIIRRAIKEVKPFYFLIKKPKIICNICGWKDNKFLSDDWHSFTICPKCRSHVRHRLFWASLHYHKQRGVDHLSQSKVLHFAPDVCLKTKLIRESKKYITADLQEEGYHYDSVDLSIDISNMDQVPDEEYNCVIAIDVLEHVKDHLSAIREVNRVLTKESHCIFMIPQKDHLVETLEDLSSLTIEERTEKFGQWDHWRIYGDDFRDMLMNAGFEVSVISSLDFKIEDVQKNVLTPPILSENPLATNFRRVYFGKKI